MTCCNQYCAAEKQFDDKKAESDLQRYRRRGPDAVTQLMLVELRRWPLHGEALLDVGSGIVALANPLSASSAPITPIPLPTSRRASPCSGQRRSSTNMSCVTASGPRRR